MAKRMWLSAGALLVACRTSSPTPGEQASEDLSEMQPPPDRSSAAAASPSGPLEFGDADPPEARRARARLVRQIQTMGEPWDGGGPWSPAVLEVMGAVPRHLFMPDASLFVAYQDRPEPIGYGQTISQPTVVAIMTDALELSGRERVLEIGTGSGYQAAVLSLLSSEVYSIELVAPLGRASKQRLHRLGYANVHVRVGDGYLGWPEHAPFDRIILTAAPPKMPQPLVTQLRDGGIIVAPVGDRDQRLVRWTKVGGRLHQEDLGAVRFVPMVHGDAGSN